MYLSQHSGGALTITVGYTLIGGLYTTHQGLPNRLVPINVEILSILGANMTLKIHQKFKIWTQAGPSWVQVGPCWAKLGPCWSYVGLCWRILGPCWAMLGNLDLLPPLREASWSELGRQVGPKLAQVGGKFGQVGAKMRHVGAKLAHVGAKLGQLRPTWPSKLDF